MKHAWPVVAALVAIALFAVWAVIERPSEDSGSAPRESVAAESRVSEPSVGLESPEDVARAEVIEGAATGPDPPPTAENAALLGRVVGTVSDEAGRPIAGALVRVGRPVSTGGFYTSDDPMVRRADGIVLTELGAIEDGAPPTAGPSLGPGVSRTDAEGRFELVDVEPGKYEVSCRHEGALDAREPEVDVVAGETAGPVALVLRPAFRLTVAVRGADGAPLAGAEVELSERAGRILGSWDAVTDTIGECRFAALRQPEVELSVLADGHRRAREVVALAPRVDNRHEITLQPGGEMRGRIVFGSTGEPLGGGPFGGSMVTRSVLDRSGGVVGKSVYVESDGTFVERGLGPGPYSITVRCPGLRVLELGPRTLEPGGSIDWGTIELEAGAEIDVLVVDAAGTPIEGARVSRFYGRRTHVPTDAAGRATLRATTGTVRVVARHADYATGYADPIDVVDSTRLETTVVLTRGGTVTGVAYREDGLTFAEGSVGLHSNDRNSVSEAPIDASGRFRFEGVSPGSYALHVSDPPTSLRASEDFEVADGETREIDAREPVRKRFEGTVVDAGGVPVAGCTIEMGTLAPAPDGSWKLRYPGRKATSDVEGRFVFLDFVAPRLEVTTPRGRRVAFQVPGRPERFTLRLPPEETGARGTVRGVVREVGSGAPIAGATVALRNAPGTSDVAPLTRQQRSTRADGAFELSAAPGAHRLEVEHAGSSREERTVTLEADGAVELDVALHPGGALALRLVADGGEERARVEVEVSVEGDPDATRTERGSLGREVLVTGLRAGTTYTVTCRTPGFADWTMEHTVEPTSGTPIEVRLER